MMNLDAINRPTWRSRNVLNKYRYLAGYVDPGERAATEYLCAECRDKPILDIGVGAGRTTSLLQRISSDYIGVDYTRELLDIAVQKNPRVKYRLMDARDLHAFADGSFYLVNFSFNAIDAVDYDDRIRILGEVNRVMQPGGVYLFSGHNATGPGARECIQTALPKFSSNPLKLGWRFGRFALSLPLIVYHRVMYSGLREERNGYVVSNAAAHNFGLVILYTTITEQNRQLAAAGFKTEAVFDSEEGREVSDDEDLSQVRWLHYIARKL